MKPSARELVNLAYGCESDFAFAAGDAIGRASEKQRQGYAVARDVYLASCDPTDRLIDCSTAVRQGVEETS
jgi:hypothetical protein